MATRLLLFAGLICSSLDSSRAREFALGGVTLDLADASTNMDVYFTSMRLNRAANEWQVEVTISNKTAQAISGPMLLVIESYSGTSGPLRSDGTASNQPFYQISASAGSSGLFAASSRSAARTLSLGYTVGGAPKLMTRVYAGESLGQLGALGFIRTLNEAGQPLPGVTVDQVAPPSAGEALQTGNPFAGATLGGAAGTYIWKLSKDGYLPVWRQSALSSNSVAAVPYARLTERSSAAFSISPLTGGGATNRGVSVRFPAAAVSQIASVHLTEVDAQALPAFLPQGWSPLQAFWLESDATPAKALTASLVPWGPIAATEAGALVQLNTTNLSWTVLQIVPGNGTNAVAVSISGAGAYALVVADAGDAAPPAAVAGQVLSPSLTARPNGSSLTAGGTVTPSASPASLVPELVTGNAEVIITNAAGPMPSGTLFRGDVSERYLLQDETTRVPPGFDTSIIGYQRPGDNRPETLHARFPMRPLLLFAPEQLNEGLVHMDFYPAGSFSGGILTTNGGVIAGSSVQLIAGSSVLPSAQVVQFRELDPLNFASLAGTNFPIVAAFEEGAPSLDTNKELAIQVSGLATNSTFVLARVLDASGTYSLEPRARLHTDANGTLINDELSAPDRLPGLSVAGQYVLLQVEPQQSVVEGIAKNSQGQPAAGLPVSIAGQPWLTFSAADGSFKLLAPVGDGILNVRDLVTGDRGSQAFTVPPGLSPVNATISASLSGLRVTSLNPADNSSAVPLVSSITVNFSRPINPGTMLAGALQLVGTNNTPVGSSVSLNLANTTATLLPNVPLDPSAQYKIVLSTNIADALGRTLEGQSQFSFTTVALSARDPAAQLIIYEPGATNVPANIVASIPGFTPGTNKTAIVVQGTPGAADPGVPVVVANESSGETTTVLSKPDGSFTTFINGSEQDFVSATLISLNGARVYIPVSRQLFDNGFVGLYKQGGILEAETDGAPVQVFIQPNSVPERTKFKVDSVKIADLINEVGGVTPELGQPAGNGVRVQIDGQPPNLPVKVHIPVDLAKLGYPTNEAPTNAAVVLAAVSNEQDVTSYQVVDQMLFTPSTNAVQNQLKAKSIHAASAGSPQEQLSAGFLDTSVGFVVGALPGGQVAQIAYGQLLVPILFGPRPVVIKGLAGAIPTELAIALEKFGVLNQVFNLQTGNENIDMPVTLAQQMGLIRNPLGNLGQITQVSAQLFQQAALRIAKPLSGAFISLRLSGGPLAGQPGRLKPGMVYCTSAADGTFLTVAPAAGAQYLIRATHPMFEDPQEQPVNPISFNPLQQGDLSLAGAVFKNFLFTTPLLSQTPPSVSVANAPLQPGPGQPCSIEVNAFLPLLPPDVHVGLVSIGSTNLETGLVETNVVATLTDVRAITNGTSVRWTGTLNANKPVRLTLKIFVPGLSAGVDFKTLYPIDFTGPLPVAPSPIPPPDTNDVHGPLVVQTDPPDNGFITENSGITIYFNKPIDRFVTNHLNGITLTGAGTPLPPVVRLDPQQQVMVLQFPGMLPNETYRLTLSGQSIRDLALQPLDQKPSTPAADSFTTTFRTPPAVSAPILGVANGRGSVISGNRLYVIDQAPQDNYLEAYDISTPLRPVLLSKTHLFGQPRDLVVLPKFAYVRNAHAPVETNDLVAVVGGDLDALIDKGQGTTVSVRGQYLWVVAMGDGTAPSVIASPIVSYRVGSAVTKVRWSAPYLVYEEFGADIQQLAFVNLQELIIGYGSNAAEQGTFPATGKSGVDKNGDGSYVDFANGETLPLPQLDPSEFYGKHQSYVLSHTTQKILDFAVVGGGQAVAVVLRNGVKLDDHNLNTGVALEPSYRTLVYNGLPLNLADPTDASVSFGTLSYPRWVSLLPAVQVVANGVPRVLSLALVSLAPDNDGVQKLGVIDISLPEQPHLLNKIPIPDTLTGGDIQSVSQRSDGYLEVAGSLNTVLLNPSDLAATNVPEGQLHPAIVDVIRDSGGITRSLGTTDYGIHAVADGARALVSQAPPRMQFVSFPNNGSLVDPTFLHLRDQTFVSEIFKGLRATGALAPARVKDEPKLNLSSDLEFPNPALHYHVLVTVPGAAGSIIQVGLESLNPAGRPLVNLGKGFAPVRAISDQAQAGIEQTPRANCGAPIRSLPAYRLSDDPNSPYYNFYLSRPFALITEAIQPADLSRLNAGADREILFSGAELRTFIDPSESANPVAGPFAAQIDTLRDVIFPISSASAFTVNRSYITGDNPPPTGGSSPMEDTYGTVQAHSGELRTSDVDMVLPSPRMPIAIRRSIGTQDNYEGPFGVGWDFNYNQRLTILDPLTFPEGLQMPLVVRQGRDDSEIAGSQDVLLHTGAGRTVHFRWVDTNMPALYAKDPLVIEFKYTDVVSDYFLPEHGCFDLLVKFKDGRFERLTSSGVRYRYSPEGRLETIIDRYPLNRHELEYDDNGWLVRIDDRSVSSPRYVEFGHLRRQGTDREFKAGLDEDTDNPVLEGKICRLRDFAGRDVLFHYSPDGFLTNRSGIKVDGENGGFSGRNQTFYNYADCQLTGISASEKGTPIINVVNTIGPSGKSVAQKTTSSQGSDEIVVPPNNSASTVSTDTTAVKMGDGTSAQRTFDKMGYVNTTTVMGTNGPPASEITSNTVDGLVYYVKHPEGNTELMTYDSDNEVFRSRANMLSIKMDPGPRGGKATSRTYHYDPRYNLPSGDQIDPNGFHITYSLTGDGRDIQTVKHGEAGTESFSYNDNGQRTHSVDVNGIEHTTEYEASTGYMLRQKLGDIAYVYSYGGGIPSLLGMASSIAPPIGTATSYTYNNLLQIVMMTRGESVENNAYDELGHRVYHQEFVGGGKQWSSRLTYDDKGFITESTMEGVEVNGSPATISYSYHPDSRSRVSEILYPDGAVQSYSYDDRGNVSKMAMGDYVQEFEHDLNNNVIAVKEGGVTLREFQYDGLNRATNVIYKTGAKDYSIATGFYPGGQLESLVVNDPTYGLIQEETSDSIDALGRPMQVTIHGTAISPQYTYAYQPLSSTITSPRMATTRTWGIDGYQRSYTDPNLKLTMQLDGSGRTRQVDRQEDGAAYSQTFTYDDLDHQTSISDLLGKMFTYVPRADGNELQLIDARGNSTDMEHTALGELMKRKRADGMEIQQKYDAERQVLYKGDPSAGFNYGYDNQLRLTNQTLRSGVAMQFSAFDGRNLPQTIKIPGGSQTLQYDLQRRILQRKINYQSSNWEEDYAYDGLNRVRLQAYTQNGGPNNTASYVYDKAGPLISTVYKEDGATFGVTNSYYTDGMRKSITYPSGASISEIRDTTGRLTGVSDAGGNIISATSWHGNSQPLVVQLGKTMQIVNSYDARGRTTGSRVTRVSDGAVLAHMRYDYDPANNLQVREYVHRGGKADVFGFDAGERLAQAQIGVLMTNAAANGPALYTTKYGYDPTGLDFLIGTSVSGGGSSAAPFATNWTAQDSFLLPTIVNGFSRGAADPMGNVARIQLWVRNEGDASPTPVSAAVEHDGAGHLIKITRADGVVIENQFQASGLRFSRKITKNGQLTSSTAYVYDDASRLIEEYDRTAPQPVLVARYYYATGDAPVAADFLSSGNQLVRYYYIRDAAMSVIAVADADGSVVERAWYDAFGQPSIEPRDTTPPDVTGIQAGPNGSILVAFSEPVVPPWTDPGVGGGSILLSNRVQAAITLADANSGASIPGTVTLDASLPGSAPGSVLRFTPSQSATGALSLTIVGGTISDEWGNTNVRRNVAFTNNSAAAGTALYSAQTPVKTGGISVAQSAIGSPFLFHGQYFDYDAGLIYLRARFYDPFSGMFLEPDPMGYEDSVNHYAGMGNNPVAVRDPSGLKGSKIGSYLRRIREKAGYTETETSLIREHHAELARKGLADHDIAAIIHTMVRQLPEEGHGSFEFGFKDLSAPAQVRRFRNQNMRTKIEEIYDKTVNGTVSHKGELYTGDVDGLYLRRGEQFLRLDEVKAFQDDVNNEVATLTKVHMEHLERVGKSAHWTEPSKPFNHGMTAHVQEEIGTAHALSTGGYFGKEGINNLLKKVKKMPEGFAITVSGTRDNPTVSLRGLSQDDVRGIFADKNVQFQKMLDPKEPEYFHEPTFIRVLEQMYRDGDVETTRFPIGGL